MQKQMGADSDEQFFKFFLNSELKKIQWAYEVGGKNGTEIVAWKSLYIKAYKYS